MGICGGFVQGSRKLDPHGLETLSVGLELLAEFLRHRQIA